MEHNILTMEAADLEQQKAIADVIAIGRRIENDQAEAERQASLRKKGISEQAPAIGSSSRA